ncbi:hypothetical protein [Sphingomonas yunnanensis]|uniref:hypothetical protein n=1 Tax=Sphingomonas yunnanensis TaxID=310400 RepID=UPI001FE98B8C|nr:hypothetical protein [Sphingomonas yunnanensis]
MARRTVSSICSASARASATIVLARPAMSAVSCTVCVISCMAAAVMASEAACASVRRDRSSEAARSESALAAIPAVLLRTIASAAPTADIAVLRSVPSFANSPAMVSLTRALDAHLDVFRIAAQGTGACGERFDLGVRDPGADALGGPDLAVEAAQRAGPVTVLRLACHAPERLEHAVGEREAPRARRARRRAGQPASRATGR